MAKRLIQSRFKRILTIVVVLGCLGAVFISLFSLQSTATASAFASIIRDDVIGELFPFQEKLLSEVPSQSNNIIVSSVCERKFLFTYSVYLDIKHSDQNGKGIRHFVAEKDAMQDCYQFVVKSVEVQNNGLAVKIDFRNGKQEIVDIEKE